MKILISVKYFLSYPFSFQALGHLINGNDLIGYTLGRERVSIIIPDGSGPSLFSQTAFIHSTYRRSIQYILFAAPAADHKQ